MGVVHNGIRLNPGATEVIEKLNDKDKEIIFLSNAPRPSASVVKFLEKLQMEKKYLKNVMTSGQAARISLEKKITVKSFFILDQRETMFYIQD